jgi:hypothetical protein
VDLSREYNIPGLSDTPLAVSSTSICQKGWLAFTFTANFPACNILQAAGFTLIDSSMGPSWFQVSSGNDLM